jgi:hypothetical protein
MTAIGARFGGRLISIQTSRTSFLSGPFHK